MNIEEKLRNKMIKRIQPLINEIDLDKDAKPEVSQFYAVAELCNTEISELAKKLLILRARGEINCHEYQVILNDHHNQGELGFYK